MAILAVAARRLDLVRPAGGKLAYNAVTAMRFDGDGWLTGRSRGPTPVAAPPNRLFSPGVGDRE